MSTMERGARIAVVRAEGRAAQEAGRHVQTNPYPPYDMDHYQWISGYYAAMEDAGDE